MNGRLSLWKVDALVITLLDRRDDLRNELGDQFAAFSRDLQTALQGLDGPASPEAYAAKGNALVDILGRYSYTKKLLAEVSAPPPAHTMRGVPLGAAPGATRSLAQEAIPADYDYAWQDLRELRDAFVG